MLVTNFEPTTTPFDDFGSGDGAGDDEDVILISAAEILSRPGSRSPNQSRLLPGLTIFDSSQQEWTIEPTAAHIGTIGSTTDQSAPSERNAPLPAYPSKTIQTPVLSWYRSSSYTFDSALAALETDLAHILGGAPTMAP